MTDPRIEAAARELKRLFFENETAPDAMWLSCAKCVLDAADAAAWRHIESAPKDAGKLLGADGDDIEVIEYIPLLDAWDNGEQTTYPSHWQPLPKPPTTRK